MSMHQCLIQKAAAHQDNWLMLKSRKTIVLASKKKKAIIKLENIAA